MKLLFSLFLLSVINIITLSQSQAQYSERGVTNLPNLFLEKAILQRGNKFTNENNVQFYTAQTNPKWASDKQNSLGKLMKLFQYKFSIAMKKNHGNSDKSISTSSTTTTTKTDIPLNYYKMPLGRLFQHRVIVSSEQQTKNNKDLHDNFSSQVAIFSWPVKENSIPICAGSLISNRFVLTTANCVEDEIRVELMFGAYNIQNSEPTQVTMESSYFIIHEEWNSEKLENNIALVKLPQSIEFNEHIIPANLPIKADAQKTFTDHYATVIGWSSDLEPGTAMLMNATDIIISNDKCSLSYSWFIHPSCICLNGTISNASCVGENGDQLIVKDEDGTIKLIGLLSFGMLGGCQRKQPLAFTRVTSYLSWIQNHVNY